MSISYKDAGVNIDAGNQAVEQMKEHVRSTFRPEVLTEIGSFAGMFALDNKKYQEPVLISGTDGVGTKLKVAFIVDKHDTIGIDAVAMCVNDILVQGAEPLFFLDYVAVGKLSPDKVAAVVKGVAEGCRQAGCALLGGETAEMPGFYPPDEYDLAGFAVGVAEKSRLITGEKVAAGDVLLALPSTGLHSNGYSLARKVLLSGAYGLKDDTYIEEMSMTVAEAMLIPTKIYVREVLPLLSHFTIKGMAHITGGGLLENLPRVFNDKLAAYIKEGSWPEPPIFDLMRSAANLDKKEMYRVFNMGVGYVLIVSSENADAIRRELPQACVIGEMRQRSGDPVVIY